MTTEFLYNYSGPFVCPSCGLVLMNTPTGKEKFGAAYFQHDVQSRKPLADRCKNEGKIWRIEIPVVKATVVKGLP